MSRRSTSFVLAYHGCREDVGKKAVSGQIKLEIKEKEYDWLGPGVYFWESDPHRAWEWAREKKERDSTFAPFVVGAVIDLGNCLDLTLRENIGVLQSAYRDLKADFKSSGRQIPSNKDPKSAHRGDKLLRYLDCAVIRRAHSLTEQANLEKYDTVRGLFVEGAPAYRGARFFDKTHTQIAVLNTAVIRELFAARPV